MTLNTKLAWIGSILLVFGLTLTLLSYPNLYVLNSELFDLGTVPIAANSSNELGFYTGIGNIKEVEVAVYNGPWDMPSIWGDCYWIQHPFEIALVNGAQFSLSITTQHSPPVTHIFDVPNTWNSLSAIRISNPENNSAAVIVVVIFHSQVSSFEWQMAMYLGLMSTIIGAIMIGVAAYRRKPIAKREKLS
jgi:hypothetical protein